MLVTVPQFHSGMLVTGTFGTSLLKQGFQIELFDGNGITGVAGSPITIEFVKPLIITGIGGFYTSDRGRVNASAGPGNITKRTYCGDGVGSVNVNVWVWGHIPFTICPQGIYATEIYIDNSNFSAEVLITGYETPPPVNEDEVNLTYSFYFDHAWFAYLEISWPRTIYPNCPIVYYTQQFGNISTTFTDGTFPEDSGNVRIFGIGSMSVNTVGVYNVTLKNEFTDNPAYFQEGPPARSLSEPMTFSISRSPACWVGECSETETGSQCVRRFNERSNEANQTDWLPVFGELGVCFVTISFNGLDNHYIQPHWSFRAILFDGDTNLQNTSVEDIPDGVLYADQSICYFGCVGGLYEFANPGFGLPIKFTENQCSWIRNNYCCDSDVCFTPLRDFSLLEPSSCTEILIQSNRSAFYNIGKCFFPRPTSFEYYSEENGDKGRLTVMIHRDIQFDQIELQLENDDRSDNRSISLTDCINSNFPDSSMPETQWDCSVSTLTPNTEYFIRLRGYTAASDNSDKSGENDGFTTLSNYFYIKTDPDKPDTGNIFVASSENELNFTGFNLMLQNNVIEAQLMSYCSSGNLTQFLGANDTGLRFSGLYPGCKYDLLYRRVCFGSRDEYNGYSEYALISAFTQFPTPTSSPISEDESDDISTTIFIFLVSVAASIVFLLFILMALLGGSAYAYNSPKWRNESFMDAGFDNEINNNISLADVNNQ